jgi:hypothetical protein
MAILNICHFHNHKELAGPIDPAGFSRRATLNLYYLPLLRKTFLIILPLTGTSQPDLKLIYLEEAELRLKLNTGKSKVRR